MAYDWDKMKPADASFAKANLGQPGYERVYPLTKRKQQGRDPTQLEIAFAKRCYVARAVGLIQDYWVKPFILRIGPDMTFEPDFMVLEIDDVFPWVIDTKGPQSWEDSRIKIKVAADRFRLWRWLLVTRPSTIWKAREVTAERGIARNYAKLPWLTKAISMEHASVESIDPGSGILGPSEGLPNDPGRGA